MTSPHQQDSRSFIHGLIRFCLERRLIVGLAVLMIVAWGVIVAPFDWELAGVTRDPVPVDAIPDIGDNQQIVFSEWPGRSPQDVEDQVTFPLTAQLMGVPGVRTIRSSSLLGISSIFVIFNEDVEFYWSRSRILEKLNSLTAGTLPVGVQPRLGPDATGLGQVFWYTLEGRDEKGRPTGGWDLHELRTIQDWNVRYALQAVAGVSEVASIGGFVQEYQIDVDPDAMRAHGVKLGEVIEAVRKSNVDVGARTIEVNRAEYIVRGLGFIKSLDDIRDTAIKINGDVPLYIRNVANVTLGPALRRGALDKGGAEAVGGVVVARFGENPLAAIDRVKQKIANITPGLPRKTLADGTVSQVHIIPFYDRSDLIRETLDTLNNALADEILITIIVVLIMVFHLRSAIVISGLLPLAVLVCFIAMKQFGVDANIVALSGIVIAIGTMVDMGIIVSENVVRHIESADADEPRLEVVHRATTEVAGAILTAVLTTIVSFLPVFTMEAAEGKLFKPLAFTKTFALLGAIAVALTIIPPVMLVLLGNRQVAGRARDAISAALILAGVAAFFLAPWWLATLVLGFGLHTAISARLSNKWNRRARVGGTFAIALLVAVLLSNHWLPLGPEHGVGNIFFATGLIGAILIAFRFFQNVYSDWLAWCLAHKAVFLAIPFVLTVWGALIWLGFGTLFVPVSIAVERIGVDRVRFETSSPIAGAKRLFPGMGKEFMPSLDEGSFLFMPSTMPHASIGESMDVLQKQDRAIRAIPEITSTVGKIGRVESPLDPAPISMTETVVNYASEYKLDERGKRGKFGYDTSREEYERDENGELIADPGGRPYRQWREHIRTPDDIWDEIVKVTSIPGSTVAPKLQPIETRLIMLQTGMRAPMGVKIQGPDLESIERLGIEIERLLKQVPAVRSEAVFADRVVGKPYLEIEINRKAIARFGLSIRDVQDVIEVAIGGRKITETVEGRERFPVRVRYPRELRDDIETIERIIVPAPGGPQIPLGQLATINYRRGPQAIKSEDSFLVSYVLFDKMPGFAEVDVVETCRNYLDGLIESGELTLPSGVSYRFTGNYENQVRSAQRLMMVLPLALLVIFMILYLQFRSAATTLLIFSGILVAWAGGFQMLWLYGQPWFLNFELFGADMRDLFQIRPYNLSVAVWVGFLALFGIATDNGVILATYLDQSFAEKKPDSIKTIRAATIAAARRRIRPCLMTSATTILALLPVLTSRGRGSDIMIPMAIPTFGGMTVVLVSVFVVPVLYCAIAEWRFRRLEAGATKPPPEDEAKEKADGGELIGKVPVDPA